MSSASVDHLVHIPTETVCLTGALALPAGAHGIVVLVPDHDRGRHGPDDTVVVQILRDARLGTLLLDFLMTEEEAAGATDADLSLLTHRLITATHWLQAQPDTQRFGIGYCGANTGAAVALQAAAVLGPRIRALVAHGGRPDLARATLPQVQAPTLLIVGTRDPTILELNQAAYDALRAPKHLAIVPGAAHGFEEPGASQDVAHLAAQWFRRYLDIKGL